MDSPRFPASSTIVVGVDTSASSAAAVRWAAAEAARRGAQLHAVHVVEPGRPGAISPDGDPAHDRRLRLDLARQSFPRRVGDWVFDAGIEVDIAVRIMTGDVTAQLARAARDAALLVIGEADSLHHRTLALDLARACRCQVAMIGAAGEATFVRLPRRSSSERASRAGA